MDDESLVMNGQINFFDWPLMKKSCQEHFKLATKTEIHFVTCWHHVVVDTVIQYSVLVMKFKIFIESINWRHFWLFLEKTVCGLENEEWPQKLELHVLEKGATGPCEYQSRQRLLRQRTFRSHLGFIGNSTKESRPSIGLFLGHRNSLEA